MATWTTDPGTSVDEPPAYPMNRQCPHHPPAELAQLRAGRPVSRVRIWDGTTPWLVTRYDDVRAVLSDARFSADASRPGYPVSSEAVKISRERGPWFVAMDDPEHARYRRMLTAEFAVRNVASMRPMVEATVAELLDGMAAAPQPVDLIEAFALALPSIVVCRILGVPYEDSAFWQEQSKALFDVTSPPDVGRRADNELRAYLDKLIAEKERDPGDDLLSRLATTYIRTGELTRRDAVSMALLLLVGGHETTAHMIGLGTLTLLNHPEQAAAVRDGDDATVTSAVEELLRLLTIVHTGRRRVATEDVEVAGVRIRAGEGVIASEPSANRDPALFAEPDNLDIHRTANHHLAFGFGVHQCLGQPLARLELQVAIPALLRRFPDLRVTAAEHELRFRDEMITYGVHELPVTWGSAE